MRSSLRRHALLLALAGASSLAACGSSTVPTAPSVDVYVVDDNPAPTDATTPLDAVAPDGAPVVDGGPIRVDVAPTVDVPQGPRCRTSADCARNQFCDGATCNGPGACVTRPTRCDANVDPVCGCDGRTYNNPCIAAEAGVRVASAGECAATPPDAGAPDTGVNACAAVRCMRGTMCCGNAASTDYGMCCATGDPRCCRAGATDAGVPPTDGGATGACTSNADCGRGQSCCVGGTGAFANRCYASACLACCMVRPPADGGTTTDAGARVDAGPTACRSNGDCGATQYCAGTGCGTAGTCQARPMRCSAIFMPVCGCDGVTYANACSANGNGVREATGGACPTTSADSGLSACATVRCASGSTCCDVPTAANYGTCQPSTCSACCR